MANRIIQTETLAAIADAIRDKTGDASRITPAQMATEILSIGAILMSDGTIYLPDSLLNSGDSYELIYIDENKTPIENTLAITNFIAV